MLFQKPQTYNVKALFQDQLSKARPTPAKRGRPRGSYNKGKTAARLVQVQDEPEKVGSLLWWGKHVQKELDFYLRTIPDHRANPPVEEARIFTASIYELEAVKTSSGGFNLFVHSMTDQITLNIYTFVAERYHFPENSTDAMKIAQSLRHAWNKLPAGARKNWEAAAHSLAKGRSKKEPPNTLQDVLNEEMEPVTEGEKKPEDYPLMPINETPYKSADRYQQTAIVPQCCPNAPVWRDFDDVKRHMLRSHYTAFFYGCHFCHYMFQTREQMEKHECNKFSQFMINRIVAGNSESPEMTAAYIFVACYECGLWMPIRETYTGDRREQAWAFFSAICNNHAGEVLNLVVVYTASRLYQEDVARPYTNRVITLWYRPPELLLGEEHYGPAVDVWSAGCILAEFFTKKAIFCGQNEPHQLELISKECGTPTKENWPDVDKLSLYKTLTPKSTYYRRLKDTFRAVMPDAALDLMDKMLIMDPSRRITASTALRHHWVKDIDPRRVQPLQLPVGQDCHELWSKQERNKRRSGLPVAPLATTMALPPPADPYIKREPKREPSVEVKPAIPPQMPAVHSVNGDSSAILAFHQAFDRFHQDPGPQARMHLQRILDTLDEEHAHDLVHRLSSLIKDKNLLTMQRSYKEKLQMMVENILAQKPSPSHQQQPPSRGAPPPGPPPPFHGRPPPLPAPGPGRPHHPYQQPPPPQQQHGGAPPYRMYR